jgi:hypothetical protein
MYGIAYPIFFLIPIWSLFTGQFVITSPIWLFLCFRIPYLACMRLMTWFMTDRSHDLKAFQMQVGLWPTYLSAIGTALTHPFTAPGYRVNPKTSRSTTFLRRAAVLWPHLAMIGGSMAAIAYGIRHRDTHPTYLAVLAFWCTWTIVSLSRYTAVALFSDRFLDRRPETPPWPAPVSPRRHRQP